MEFQSHVTCFDHVTGNVVQQSRRVYFSSPVASATFKFAHSCVTSMAAIFGAVMLRVHFDGLVLTASAAQHDKKLGIGINVIKQCVKQNDEQEEEFQVAG
jgi:hypothetical protein